MWIVAVRKSDWIFQIFDLLLLRNYEIWNSRESKSIDFFLQEIKFLSMRYDDEKKCCDRKELI